MPCYAQRDDALLRSSPAVAARGPRLQRHRQHRLWRLGWVAGWLGWMGHRQHRVRRLGWVTVVAAAAGTLSASCAARRVGGGGDMAVGMVKELLPGCTGWAAATLDVWMVCAPGAPHAWNGRHSGLGQGGPGGVPAAHSFPQPAPRPCPLMPRRLNRTRAAPCYATMLCCAGSMQLHVSSGSGASSTPVYISTKTLPISANCATPACGACRGGAGRAGKGRGEGGKVFRAVRPPCVKGRSSQ